MTRTSNEDAASSFDPLRPRLTRIAYRMLGSVADAEDVVQDAFLRWLDADRAAVREPEAFLRRVVTRLSLDVLKSARRRRETYVGPWLPEPVVEAADEEADDVTLPLLLALDRLAPLERAAFLLHDVFGLPLGEVAEALEREPGAVRQLAVRARRHVQAARPRFPVDRAEGERIAQAFFAASISGDVATLRTLLAEDVVLQADGGGKVLAFLNPITGMARLLRLFAGIRRKWGEGWATMVQPAWIDGLPGYVSLERGAVLQTTAFAIEGGRIAAIYITRNPDKLLQVAAMGGPVRS